MSGRAFGKRPPNFVADMRRRGAPYSPLAWSVVLLMSSEEPLETLECDALEAFDVAIAEPIEALSLALPSPKADPF